MKIAALTLAALGFGGFALHGIDIRETQFPANLPKTIVVAGADYATGKCLKPWVAKNPVEYSGTYRSWTITDGSARLELILKQAKSTEGDIRWHVDGVWETKIGAGFSHEVTFKNAELQEPKQPCFDVLERLTPGLFVIFTDPDIADSKPQHAVVIGDKIFILEKESKRGR